MCVYVCTRGHLKGAQVWLGLLKSFGRNTKGCMVGNGSIEVYRVGGRHRNGYGNGESEYFSVGYSHHGCHNMGHNVD